MEGTPLFTVELAAEEGGETIDCNFKPEHKAKLEALKTGQHVTIRGRCKGKFVGSVILDTAVLK
jgi:hypothetical protein